MCSNFLPLNFTILSEKLHQGGYKNYFIGKGHLGYETTDHLPINRGFDSHVGYLGGSEGYEYGSGSKDPTKGSHDMWHNHGPGIDVVPEIFYSANFYTSTAINIIKNHSQSRRGDSADDAEPFFMYLAIQNVHSPYTLPPAWETHEYPAMWDKTYANMLAMLDESVGNLTHALKESNLWDDTLILFTADNGGIGRGNNHPLRGHKHDPWEGGTRATAFLSGGFLPQGLRNTTSGAKLVHVADWYPTFLRLANVSSADNVLIDGAVHGIDGVDVWDMLVGTNATQPRAITPTSETGAILTLSDTEWYKLITLAGKSNYYYPNQTKYNPPQECLASAQKDPSEPGRTDAIVNGCPVCNETLPCLYALLDDLYETTNVANAHPDVVTELAAAIKRFEKYYVSGHLPPDILKAKYKKFPDKHWGGYKGPCYYPRDGPDPGPPAPGPAPPQPQVCTQCNFENGVHYPGKDIASHNNVANATECCRLCKESSACKKFAYSSDSRNCNLKSEVKNGKKATGFISGHCSS